MAMFNGYVSLPEGMGMIKVNLIVIFPNESWKKIIHQTACLKDIPILPTHHRHCIIHVYIEIDLDLDIDIDIDIHVYIYIYIYMYTYSYIPMLESPCIAHISPHLIVISNSFCIRLSSGLRLRLSLPSGLYSFFGKKTVRVYSNQV